jgi:hypothetical protein
MEKLEILENIVGMLHSSFIDDNYTSSTAHRIYDDCVEYAIEELEEYGIPYTEEEIRNYFEGKI